MRTETHSAFNRPYTVHIEAFGRIGHCVYVVAFFFAVAYVHRVQIFDAFIEYGCVAGCFDILKHGVRQEKLVVGEICPYSALPFVPPVQHIALYKLTLSAFQYVSLGELRLGLQQRQNILKLISEAVCAAALVVARSSKKA